MEDLRRQNEKKQEITSRQEKVSVKDMSIRSYWDHFHQFPFLPLQNLTDWL